jgi:hypothetical protein
MHGQLSPEGRKKKNQRITLYVFGALGLVGLLMVPLALAMAKRDDGAGARRAAALNERAEHARKGLAFQRELDAQKLEHTNTMLREKHKRDGELASRPDPRMAMFVGISKESAIKAMGAPFYACKKGGIEFLIWDHDTACAHYIGEFVGGKMTGMDEGRLCGNDSARELRTMDVTQKRMGSCNY